MPSHRHITPRATTAPAPTAPPLPSVPAIRTAIRQPRSKWRYLGLSLWAVSWVCLCAQVQAQDDSVRVAPPVTPATAAKGTPSTTGDGKSVPEVININTADAATLQRLPGIGPAKAEAIIALRTRIKSFKRVEQLMRVRGIGRKTFRKLRPMLAISGPTTLDHKVSGRAAK